MSEAAAFARRGYSGAAEDTTLSGGITDSASSFDGTDLSSWTDTITDGPARATITDGTTEEEFEFTGISTNTFTGVTRGVGGTTARAWDAGARIFHGSSTRDFDEANYTAAETVGKITAANQLLRSDGANSLVADDIAASRFYGRKASGDAGAMTVAEAKTLLAYGTAAAANTGYAAGNVPVVASGTPDGSKFLRDDGVWATAGGALTVAEAALGANVTMTTGNTFYDGPSVSLAAGTWFIVGHVLLYSNAVGSGQNVVAKLWDGTTVEDSDESVLLNNSVTTLVVSGIVTPGSTTTYKISATGGTGSGSGTLSMLAAALTNSPGNNASSIRAVKVA